MDFLEYDRSIDFVCTFRVERQNRFGDFHKNPGGLARQHYLFIRTFVSKRLLKACWSWQKNNFLRHT